MAKHKAKGVKRPASPRKFAEWEAGNWAGASQDKIKYYYCKSGHENLVSIAKTLAGQATGDSKHPQYQNNITWEDITQLNFETTKPEEINWYLEKFNGCGTKITGDGWNYSLDIKDTKPWLWIPTQIVLQPIVLTITRLTKRVLNLPPPHDDFSRAIADRFSDIDKNDDGFLSKKEIDVALGSTSFAGREAAAVATLKKHLEDYEEFSDDEWGDEDDGITLADITAYDRLRLRNPKHPIIVKMNNMYNHANGKINNANKAVFSGRIDALSVEQGMIGDCWFLAAIVGLANIRGRGEHAIKNMITPLAGDKYKVRFPGVKKPIIVSKPTDGEIAMFSSAGANGLWLSILEKSYGASVNRDKYFFLVTTSHYDAADGGDFIEKGIEIMTGNEVDDDWLVNIYGPATDKLILLNKLRTAFDNNKVVTAGIRGEIFGDNFRDNGLPMGHAYTVVGFDYRNQTIQLRNPWGHGGIKWPVHWPIVRGVFEMTIADFMDNYSFIALEQ